MDVVSLPSHDLRPPEGLMPRALFRLLVQERPRLARGTVEDGPAELLDEGLDLDDVLAGPGPTVEELWSSPAAGPAPPSARILAPVAGQEVWASGVTFERSRQARNEEAGPVDFYDRVYSADRPELFLKAAPGRVRGPAAPIGIRADSGWDVPEPELALVADAAGRLVGYTVGNDVSSRSIEGENPLYLAQAKIFTGSCAVGPALVPVGEVGPLAGLSVQLEIRRGDDVVFTDSVGLAQLRRRPTELLGWLFQALDFPVGVVLLTGTSIVPPPDLTLDAGDVVTVSIPGVGTLVNPVEVVGSLRPRISEEAGG
jgi:2-dehydro-3-deoxy-D-arabinonate dehydratase